MRRWKQAMGVIVSFALVAAMLLPMSALAGEQAIPTHSWGEYKLKCPNCGAADYCANLDKKKKK